MCVGVSSSVLVCILRTRCLCPLVIAARHLPQIANVSRCLALDPNLGGSDSIPIGEGIVLVFVLLFLVVRRLGLPRRRDGGLRRPRRPGRGSRTRRLWGRRARLESQASHSRERRAVRRKGIFPPRSLGCHFGQLVYRLNKGSEVRGEWRLHTAVEMGLFCDIIIRVTVGVDRAIKLLKRHQGCNQLIIGMKEAA